VGGPIFAVLVEAGVYAAQLGFPLRPGDWKSTTKSEGSGDWIKALAQSPACTTKQLSTKKAR
jgi:hypothetical protein